MLCGGIFFCVNRFWFFNGILLQGEILLNQGLHLARMFFLHINHSVHSNLSAGKGEGGGAWGLNLQPNFQKGEAWQDFNF